jgi:CRP-like cAMP-binding protein
MKIKVLGCLGGKVPGQELTALLVDQELAMDAGGLAASLDAEGLARIKHVLISHSHLDHIYGLAYLLESRFYSEVSAPLEIYASAEALENIGRHLLAEDIVNLPAINNLKKLVKLVAVEPGREFQAGKYLIEPVAVSHFGGALGYFVSDGKNRFLYTSDTGPSDEVWEKLKAKPDCKLVITEVSFPNELSEVAALSRHLTPELLRGELKKAQPADREIYLYHLKPGYLDLLFQELTELSEYDLHLLKIGMELNLAELGHPEKAMLKLRSESVSGKVPKFDFGKNLDEQRQSLDREFGLTFEPGEIICTEGEPGKHLYVIQDGQAEVYRMVAEKKKVLAILGPGDIFGEMSVFFNQPRTASVRAMARVRVYAFDRSAFEQLVRENYGIAIKMIRMLAQRLQEADVQIENLLYRDNDSKVINTLVRAVEDAGIKTKSGHRLRLLPEQLAATTDLPAEEVKKVLARLIQNGVIVFKDGLFLIPDLERLRRLLGYLELKQEFDPPGRSGG